MITRRDALAINPLEIECNPPLTGQYVSVYLPGTVVLTLCEVKVYKGISHLKPSQIKEKATEILVEFQKHNLKGMWLQELTNRINATLPRTRNVTQGYVSKSLGKSIGGRSPFYITSDGRVFNHRGQDRGEFIKGVI